MWLSTQELPCSDPAWVVAPTSATNAEVGDSLRTARAPVNGVAPSSVALINRIGVRSTVSIRPSICNGATGLTGHQVHGAENQIPPQAGTGAARAMEKPSARTLR